MRAAPLAALGAAALLTVPAHARGTAGPFAGVVRQSQTQSHSYDNNPLNQDCPQYVVYYTIRLSHLPATDTLTLGVAGVYSAKTVNGATSITIGRSPCTSFGITVTGTSVADAAAYVVTVTGGAAGGAVLDGLG